MGISFVAQGYRKRGSTKWRRIHSAEPSLSESYRGWQIHITHRQVGVTVRRQQYSVKLDQTGLEQTDHFLSGFSSQRSALEAAHRYIDLHGQPEQPRKPLAQSPLKRPTARRS